MSERVLTIRAHAKINLDLRIVATRADGYHDVATLFQAIALHDTLRFTPNEGPLCVSCDAPAVPTDRHNLVWRAAEGLWRAAGRFGIPRGVRIELTKEIPVQSGLGGGSADAAMALLALRRIWRLDVSDEGLRTVAAALGADVPFFLVGGTASGHGRGDRLRVLPDLPSHRVLIARPPFGISTSDAYRWYDDAAAPVSAPSSVPEGTVDWRDLLSRCRNDLEPAVAARHPAIRELIRSIRAHGPTLAMMSGSGSAVFGLFAGVRELDAAASGLASAGVEVWKTATLGRAAYWAEAGIDGAAVPFDWDSAI